MAGPTVVELARAAVRRLADAAPAADVACEALELIERVGIGPPYTVALAGDLAARTELLNTFAGYLAGQRLFDPARHDPARVVLTLRRGATTVLRARRRDGTVEQRELGPVPPRQADRAPAGEPRNHRSAPRHAEVAMAGAPPIADVSVFAAEPETTLLVRRPPWWALWRWPAFWWRAWRVSRASQTSQASHASHASHAFGARRALSSGPPAPALLAPIATSAEPASREPRDHLAPREPPPPSVEPPRHLVEALRSWFADEAVERLFVEVGSGPLPEQVVVIELPLLADARALDAAGADACLVACGERGFAMTRQLEAVLAIVPHLFVVGVPGLPLGCAPQVRLLDATTAASDLVRLATLERQIAVGHRALATLSTGCDAIDDVIADAESGFRARIERLTALHIPDADDYTAQALSRVRQTIVEHAHRLIQRALDQLDGAVERFGAAWSAQLQGAGSTDALRTAAARLDEESPAALQAAQAEAHRALVDDLTEHARAHYRELVSELRRDTTRTDAVPSWLTVDVRIDDMTSGTSLGAVAPRLTSLFRSLDALKADALAHLEQRIAKLRQVATANMLDTEPRLEPAVTGTVAVALRADVERHSVWLEAELARERIAIDAERAQLTAIALVGDTARADERQLAAMVASLTSELP